MRMDEYQQWLAAQFVEEEEELQPPAEPMAVVHEVVAEATLETETPVAVSVSSGIGQAVSAEFEGDTAPNMTEQPTVEPFPAYNDVKVSVPPPSPAAPFSAIAARTWDDDADVPAIENYLPFLRPAAPASSEAIAAIPDDAADQAAVEIDAEQAFESRGSESGIAEPADPLEVAAEPVLPLDLLESMPNSDASVNDSTESRSDSIDAIRPVAPGDAQTPAFRGRRARNVNVTRSLEPVQFDSLWNLVPKHIQVLVAMGSDDEVVQNSYKRSFKESRIELIEKLLDPTLSLEDTARLLNVCPTTVRRYTNKGMLTHQRTTGDQRRFKLSDVLTFLEAQAKPEQRSPRRTAQS